MYSDFREQYAHASFAGHFVSSARGKSKDFDFSTTAICEFYWFPFRVGYVPKSSSGNLYHRKYVQLNILFAREVVRTQWQCPVYVALGI